MKKIFFLATAVVALASCSSNDVIEVVNEPQQAIGFDAWTNNATRNSTSGALNDYHQTFGVWSYKTVNGTESPAVMTNYQVSYATDGTQTDGWSYDGATGTSLGQSTKYWDKTAVYQFYAYAPYSTAASISGAANARVISIAVGEYAANENLQTTLSTAQNTSTFTGDGSSTNNKTTDWMIAEAITGRDPNTAASPVQENFKHTLAKLVLILKRSATFKDAIIVNTVSIDGVYGTGSYNGSVWNLPDTPTAKNISGVGGSISTDENYYSMEYLVMPKAADVALKFNVNYTLNDENFVLTDEAITGITSIAGNTVYTITATIGPDPIEFSTSVTDFEHDETGSVVVD